MIKLGLIKYELEINVQHFENSLFLIMISPQNFYSDNVSRVPIGIGHLHGGSLEISTTVPLNTHLRINELNCYILRCLRTVI